MTLILEPHLFGLVTEGARHPSLWSSTERAKQAVEEFIKEDWGGNFRKGVDEFRWEKKDGWVSWTVEVWADGYLVSDFPYRVWTVALSEVFSYERT